MADPCILGGRQAACLISRRQLPVAGLALAAGCSKVPPRPKARVFIAKAAHYNVDLVSLLERGIEACGLEVHGKRVLLKPNLVEFDSSTAINTNVAVIAAALEVFRKKGAASVVVAEGPGHRRDTIFLAEEARYRSEIEKFEELFVDLNRDDVSSVRPFATLPEIFLPRTALAADLIVSLAKMKTHHWAGATLSMKNLFGLVPGSVYGWPKNILHRIGITRSILELNRVFRNTFAIVDGIVAMEGNGPIQGTPKAAGVLVMGSDLPAVDATCCRMMDISPDSIEYLRLAEDLGQTSESQIEQCGETLASVKTTFRRA
ncbi:MAG: DUF362 domain-containing protein [Bryobacteraceae bacterium]|nr:DUF362 domain-containing protein [Bryobacteraceae bacterium]MDW8377348.1 DUF362 domain-containing protein [Bryobacterales bacterium]